jgi:hypothetical protein
MIISRRERTVIVRHPRSLHDLDEYDANFGAKVGFRAKIWTGDLELEPQIIFYVEADGKWTPSWCSEGGRPKIAEEYGIEFAKTILYHKLWEKRQGIDFEVD